MTRITKILLSVSILFLTAGCHSIPGQDRIRVACVGDSITWGYFLPCPASQSYPAQLQDLLGDSFHVGKFAMSGSTLSPAASFPFPDLHICRRAIDFNADFVVIGLGSNDAKDKNWSVVRDRIVEDYGMLISRFRQVNPDSDIILLIPPPVFTDSRPTFPSRAIVRDELPGKIAAAAEKYSCSVIDLYSPFKERAGNFPDGLHPDREGAALIAEKVAELIRRGITNENQN